MKNSFDVVGVGANSVDYVYRLPGYPQKSGPNAKMRISSQTIGCGGQVATALSTCARMGLRTKYIGALGNDDNARRMRGELERRGIDIGDVLTRNAANPSAVILIEEHEGERIVLWDRPDGLALSKSDLPAEAIAAARLVHVDDVDEDAAIEAAAIGRRAGRMVTSDIERVAARTEELISAVTIPVLADRVPAALTGEDDPERGMRRLRRLNDGLIVVTLGAEGALLLEGDRFEHVPAVAIEAVDTTGAGDVFRGALIVALLNGDPASRAVRFANAAAAVSCTRLGAMNSAPTVEEVLALTAGH